MATKKRKTNNTARSIAQKTRRTAASGGAWHPVCRPFAGGAGLCGGRFGMEGPARCAVRTFWLRQLCTGRGSVLPCCAVYPGRRPSAQDLQAGSGLVFACGTVIVFSDIQPQGMSAFQMTAACYANGVNAWIGGGALGALLGGSCCCCADGLRQPLS